MSYHDPEQLRQALLELHYDLLDESEAQSLREAIEHDEFVAAEWRKVQSLVDQIASAASLHDVELPTTSLRATDSPRSANVDEWELDERELVSSRRRILQTPSGENGSSPLPPQGPAKEYATLDDRTTRGSEDATASNRRRWSLAQTSSAVAIAATLGLAVIGSWYFTRLPERPPTVIRLQARQVPGHLARSDQEFQVVTSRVEQPAAAGRFPVTPAFLSFSVLAREVVLFSGTTRTDDQGAGRIALPQDLVVPPGAKLRVTAESTRGAADVSTLEMPLEPTRCVTYLTVDRPVYRPGETLYFRSLTLPRRSLIPVAEFPIRYELLGPDGSLVHGAELEGVTQSGVGNGAFVIPGDVEPGQYVLRAESLDGLFPDEQQSIEVHAYRVPQFEKQLRFHLPSYRGGDSVRVEVSASRISGEPLDDAVVHLAAEFDGRVIEQTDLTTTASGTGDWSFRLPPKVNNGAGEVRMVVQKDGVSETTRASIPIRTGQLSVRFYPEGGYLVAGLENRIYVTVHDAEGLPVELKGEVVDGDGNRVAELSTTRDGLGRFSFRPSRDRLYRLEVAQSRDIDGAINLPEVVEGLPVMDTGGGVFDMDDPITMVIREQQSRRLLVRAACRGRLVAELAVEVQPGENAIELPLDREVSGVVRVTVLDPQVTPARPLIERLVYRRPRNQLRVELGDQNAPLHYRRGESVRLPLRARDESGNPVAAILGVSVVDEAALSLDQRNRPSLNTQFLLLSEIESPERLEDADFYLSDLPDAARSVDLLLGTQGWRRFLTRQPPESHSDFREQLIRLLEMDGEPRVAARQFDNGKETAAGWIDYQRAVDHAWQSLLVDLRRLALLVVFVWLAVFLLQRRGSRSQLAGCLWVAMTSLLIYGCGASQDAMVASTQATADNAAKVNALPIPRTVDGLTDVGSEPAAEEEMPARWVDWLDESKAAWLLRVTQRSAGQASESLAEKERSKMTRQELRQLMEARGIGAEALADEILAELQFPIRQYAHRRPALSNDSPQSVPDLAETLYWHPLLETDPQGRATIQFELPDSETTFRVQIDGHTDQGRIGSFTTRLRVGRNTQ